MGCSVACWSLLKTDSIISTDACDPSAGCIISTVIRWLCSHRYQKMQTQRPSELRDGANTQSNYNFLAAVLQIIISIHDGKAVLN